MMTEPGFRVPAASASSSISLAMRSLHRTGGIEIFQLGQDACLQAELMLQMGQLQQRGPADELVCGCINSRHIKFLLKAVPAPGPARGAFGALWSCRTAAKPRSRSARMSSMCSVPTDRRMVLGRIPWSSSSLWGQLAVGGGGRVDHQALDVSHVGQKGEDLKAVNEAVRLGSAALDLKGEDGAAALGEIALVQGVVRMIGQRGWFTRSTWGWRERNSTTFWVFSLWRSRRRERVSMP